MAEEHFGPSTKKVRGRAQASDDLIDAMLEAAADAEPITGRGIGYKLFTRGLIPSMDKSDMRRVYRLLLIAREEGIIPWHWIVDETREAERVPTWDDPADYVRTLRNAYRRDFWLQQPRRVEVWSEKGTVRGVLQPVLNKYGVNFRVMHGFNGATSVHDIAEDDDGRELVALYVGDYDPSGMFMSERDLPERLEEYGDDDNSHVTVRRVTIVKVDLGFISTFPASDKKKDPRYKWFVQNHGDTCAELDALDPNELRTYVEEEIKGEIEPVAWARCEKVNKAEQESLRTVLDSWKAAK